MIYRKRLNKHSYELKVTPKGNFLKLAIGKRVWYFPLWNVFHNLVGIKDLGYTTTVTHESRKDRVTVSRQFVYNVYEAHFLMDKYLELAHC